MVLARDSIKRALQDHPPGVQGTVRGNIRRGRQTEKEMEVQTSKNGPETSSLWPQWLAHNRQKWNRLVPRSSMQRPYDPGG